MFELIFGLVSNHNRDVKERASDALEAITMEVNTWILDKSEIILIR